MTCEAIVIGGSAGATQALSYILPKLPADFPPIAVVQHLPANSNSFMCKRLNDICNLTVREAEDKEPLIPGYVYFSPPNYHLLVEFNRTFSLSIDEKVNFSRPSIDILFETAAEAFCSSLTGVILTGASHDGAAGLAKIRAFGGRTIVQDPVSAEVDTMPLAAMHATSVDHVLPLDEIGPFLWHICLSS